MDGIGTMHTENGAKHIENHLVSWIVVQYCFWFFLFCMLYYIGIVTLAGVCSLPFRLAHTRAHKHFHITNRELRVLHMESRRIQQVKKTSEISGEHKIQAIE